MERSENEQLWSDSGNGEPVVLVLSLLLSHNPIICSIYRFQKLPNVVSPLIFEHIKTSIHRYRHGHNQEQKYHKLEDQRTEDTG